VGILYIKTISKP